MTENESRILEVVKEKQVATLLEILNRVCLTSLEVNWYQEIEKLVSEKKIGRIAFRNTETGERRSIFYNLDWKIVEL